MQSINYRLFPIIALAMLVSGLANAQTASISAPKACLRDNCLQYKMTTRDGYTIYLREWKKLSGIQHNSTDPALLMMPGFPHTSMLVWEKQVNSALANNYRIVTMEIRGHGDSSKPINTVPDFTIPDAPGDYGQPMSHDIYDAITLLSLNNTVLMSHSHSGTVLTDYLHNYGDSLLKGIVLTSSFTKLDLTNPGVGASVFTVAAQQLIGGLFNLDDDLGDFYRTAFSFGDLSFHRNPGDNYKAKITATDLMMPPATRQAMFLPPRFSDNAVLSTISVPSLIVHGNKDALILPQHAIENYNLLKSGASRSKIRILEGVGHFAQTEDPVVYNKILKSFLEGL